MKKLLLLISPVLFLIACSDGGGNSNSIAGCMDETALNYNANATVDDGSCEYENTSNPNRTALLNNVTNNIIIPSYENLINDLNDLKSIALSFTNNPTQESLNEVRKAWVKTYVTWQPVEMFNINLAEEMEYYKTMNTYPCTPGYIENNIETQSYDLNSITLQSRSSQGLPAVDYMLYGLNNDTNEIINYYTGTNGANYGNYLNDLIDQMQLNTNAMISDWQNQKESFINSSGNTATSSVNKLSNDFVFYYEKGFRANKIGIPVGKWNGWEPYEYGVEAYYRRDISKRLALKALSACKDFFLGKSIQTGTIGYSYVDLIASNGDETLSTDILYKFDQAEIALNNLNDDFRSHLSGNNTPMVEAYNTIQQAVVSLKVEMLGILTISADYADSDGD